MDSRSRQWYFHDMSFSRTVHPKVETGQSFPEILDSQALDFLNNRGKIWYNQKLACLERNFTFRRTGSFLETRTGFFSLNEALQVQ